MSYRAKIAEGQHDARATLHLSLGKRNRLVIVVTAQYQDNLTGEVLKSLIRPGDELRTALCRHLHSIGDFNMVTRECGRFV